MIQKFEKIIEQKVTKRLDKLEETIAAYHRGFVIGCKIYQKV